MFKRMSDIPLYPLGNMPYQLKKVYVPRAKAPPRRRKVAPRIKKGQSSFERKQPTAVTTRNAEQISLYRTPLWPASKLIKDQLYYTYSNTLTGISGVTATHVYSCNGLYDPDITATGHQPMGFDLVMQAYEHYAVIRAKITVGFVNNSSYAVRAGIYLSPDGTPLTDPSELVENGLVKHVLLDGKGGADTDPGVSGRLKTITLDCDLKKFFGKGKYSELLETDYRGTVAANPAEQAYFNVFAFSSHTGVTNSQVLFDATISYDSIYFEPRKIGIS